MKTTLSAMVLWLAMGVAALAQGVTDRVLEQLAAQGYEVVAVQRTWLGRIRVIAQTDDLRRELVFHPATGEILRDYVVTLASLEPPTLPAQRSARDSGARTSTDGSDDMAATATADAGGDALLESFVLPEPVLPDFATPEAP